MAPINEKIVAYVRNSLSTAEDILKDKTRDATGRQFESRFGFLAIRKNVDDFVKGKRDSRWVLMPGLRGTGKTTILAQIYLHLKEKWGVQPNRLLYVQTDEVVGLLKSNLHEVIKAYEYIHNQPLQMLDEPLFLLVDEAHFDKDWAIALKSAAYDKSTQVFILTTGSSAMALNKSADVIRRTRIERVFPLRFVEYMKLKHRIFPETVSRDVNGKGVGISGEVATALMSSTTAQQVYDKVRHLATPTARYYSKVKPGEVERYLANGALPYLFNLKPEEAYSRILDMVEVVINKDIKNLDSFDVSTLGNFSKLLFLLAVCEESVSVSSLASQLQSNPVTVTEMLRALEQTEIIDAIPSYGSVSRKINKPPRYVFYSPVLKAALLWKIGRFMFDTASYGHLFEDVAALYLARLKATGLILAIGRPWGEGLADYIVTSRDGKEIVFEFGFGKKSGEQVKKTMQLAKAKYGVVVYDGEPKVQDNIVFIPKEVFLLM